MAVYDSENYYPDFWTLQVRTFGHSLGNKKSLNCLEEMVAIYIYMSLCVFFVSVIEYSL